MQDWRTYVAGVLGIVGLISASIFIGGTDPKTGIPDPITVGGVTHTFTHSDETTNETLLIYTDKAVYTDGFSGATMYLAVVNASGVGQDIELNGYFADDKRRMSDISVLSEITTERFEPVMEEQCREEKATTTCEWVQVSTTTIQETSNVWVPLNLKQRTPAEVTKETLALSGKVERKAVGSFEAKLKSSPFFVSPGGVVYYKLVVAFPPQQPTEMLIEAIGSEGGYGFLN